MKSLVSTLLESTYSKLQLAAEDGEMYIPFLRKIGNNKYEDEKDYKSEYVGKGPFYVFENPTDERVNVATINKLYYLLGEDYESWFKADFEKFYSCKTLKDAAVYILKNYCNFSDKEIKDCIKSDNEEKFYHEITGDEYSDKMPVNLEMEDLTFIWNVLHNKINDRDFMKEWERKCNISLYDMTTSLLNTFTNITIE